MTRLCTNCIFLALENIRGDILVQYVGIISRNVDITSAGQRVPKCSTIGTNDYRQALMKRWIFNVSRQVWSQVWGEGERGFVLKYSVTRVTAWLRNCKIIFVRVARYSLHGRCEITYLCALCVHWGQSVCTRARPFAYRRRAFRRLVCFFLALGKLRSLQLSKNFANRVVRVCRDRSSGFIVCS